MAFEMQGGIFEGGSSKPTRPEKGPDLLEIMAHPITAVYVDDYGLVCYERLNAPPLLLNTTSPVRSRIEAKRRAEAALLHAPEVGGITLYDVTISETLQKGLTYRELVTQTRKAIEDSFKREQILNAEAIAKAKKYKLI